MVSACVQECGYDMPLSAPVCVLCARCVFAFTDSIITISITITSKTFTTYLPGIVNHNNLRLHLDNHLHALPSQMVTIYEGVDGCAARLVHHERHSGRCILCIVCIVHFYICVCICICIRIFTWMCTNPSLLCSHTSACRFLSPPPYSGIRNRKRILPNLRLRCAATACLDGSTVLDSALFAATTCHDTGHGIADVS